MSPPTVIPALRLRTLLLLSHALVLALPVLAIVGTGALQHDLRAQTLEDLDHQAALISLLVRSHLERQPPGDDRLAALGSELGPVLVEARQTTLASIRLVDRRGRVVASSGDGLGEDLSGLNEVAQALRGVRQVQVRPRDPPTTNPLDSDSRRADVRLFLAAPLIVHGEPIGAVLLSRTPREELQALYRMLPAWVIAIPLLLTTLIALVAAQVFSRSLRLLERTASRLAEGPTLPEEPDQLPIHSRVLEVRHLATAFGTTATRLRERLAYIGEFAGNVSHEFKTPIATLRGTAELLRDDPDMPAEQRNRFLDNALAELDHLQKLVGGLLTLARAEEHARHSPVDLDGLIASAVIDTEVVVTGSAGVVPGDAGQLRAVIDNLIDNARTHGGPGVSVRIEAWRREGEAGFDVIDDGVGISEANLAKVFDRFFTTRRGKGGTGLGLALVRAICRAHGGEVGIRSGGGETRCSVGIPLVGTRK